MEGITGGISSVMMKQRAATGYHLEYPEGSGAAGISAALEKQPGLKSTKVKANLDSLVVDHVERVPSAN
jgi:uncharacterized protein (TIGR03435 family)